MPIDAPGFWEQVRLGEDTALELKEVRFKGRRVQAPRRDDLADELAAFANSQGGRLVLGVSDDRKPQSLDPDQLDTLAGVVTEICTDSIKPPLVFSIHRVPSPGTSAAIQAASCWSRYREVKRFIPRPAAASGGGETPSGKCSPQKWAGFNAQSARYPASEGGNTASNHAVKASR